MLGLLRWAGLDWDEGPDIGGPHAPYVQSERLERYTSAVATLEARGLIYPCTCTRKEVSLQSAPHGLSELGPVYAGACRDGASRPGAPAALRFRMPDLPPSFVDGVLGEVAPLSPAPGDFVLRRADGLFSYQLAVVVDDVAMAISEVLRGDDLLSSTPWQLALYDGLGSSRPRFAHVPLMRGPDGVRLAKRDAATSVAHYRRQGVTAEKIIGFLAHSAGLIDRVQALSASELIADFSLHRLLQPAALAKWDLDWLAG